MNTINQTPEVGHIDSAKYVATNQTQKKLTAQSLIGRFPHLEFIGDIQQTGILGRNRFGDYEIFVRHPWWVPVKQTDNSIQYGAGGIQTEEHIMYLLGRCYGEGAQTIAQNVIDALKRGNEMPYNALSIGKEQEAVAHDAFTGTIVPLVYEEQFEFQAAVHEDALPPFHYLHEAIAARIKLLDRRTQTHPGLLLMDTSAPLSGSPNDLGMQLNNGAGGSYIRPWSEYLKKYLVFSDPSTVRLLNAIARANNYTSYHELMTAKGFQTLWPSVACQTSIGMPHLRDDNGHYTFPLEIAIATADLFNSHLGIVADMLMASSPFVFGIAPVRLHDYRMALRHIFVGAQPCPFIQDLTTLKQRWQSAGIGGMLYTLDRLAFQTKRRGHDPHAMIYGSARVRVESKNAEIQLGRVENTIAGSSPSLLDEIAHDAYIYLLTVAAHEAIAHGKMPADYYGDRFQHARQWRNRKSLTSSFNNYGAKHSNVNSLLKDTLELLDYLRQEYQPLVPMIDFVTARISNIQSIPMPDLQSYFQNPQGPISEVMMAMHDNGSSPFEILKEAHSYQLRVAKEIAPMAGSKDLFEHLNERFHYN